MHYVVVLKCYQKKDRHFDRACYTFFKVSSRIFCEFAVKLKSFRWMYIQRNKNILAFLKFSWLYKIRYCEGGKIFPCKPD